MLKRENMSIKTSCTSRGWSDNTGFINLSLSISEVENAQKTKKGREFLQFFNSFFTIKTN